MTEQEFKKQYLCEWGPDPLMQEIVAFMRWATDEDIREYRREGVITHKQMVEAKRIIEQEAH